MEPVDGGARRWAVLVGSTPGRAWRCPGPAGSGCLRHQLDGGGDGTTGRNTNWVGHMVSPGPATSSASRITDHVAIARPAGRGRRGAPRRQRPARGQGRRFALSSTARRSSVWGPGISVAINNGGSLGGTGTIRVQGGIYLLLAEHRLGADHGRASRRRRPHGRRGPRDHGRQRPRGRGRLPGDVAAGGSLSLRPNTWMAADSPAPPRRSGRGHARAHRRRRLLPGARPQARER